MPRAAAWLSCGSGGTGALAHGGTRDTHALARSLIPDGVGDGDGDGDGCGDDEACVAVAAGGMHTVAWRRGGDASTLVVCGDNSHGQLGVHATTVQLAAHATPPSHAPSPLHMALPASWGEGRRVAAVACGWRHTAVVLADGSVWTCGYGADGQLGLGGGGDVGGGAAGLSRVPLPSAVSAVACGHVHTVVADVAGVVWGWGRDRHGCLALPPPTAGGCQRAPVLLAAANAAADGDRAVAVCAGANHSAALTAGGRVLTWGDNRHGQCGRRPLGEPHTLPPGYVRMCGAGASDDDTPDLSSGGTLLCATRLASGWSHMAALAVGAADDGAVLHAVSAPSAAAGGATVSAHARPPLLVTWGRGDMGQLGRRVAGPPGGGGEGDGGAGRGSRRAHDWRPAPVALYPAQPDTSAAPGGRAAAPAPQQQASAVVAAMEPRGVACGSEHGVVVTACGRVLAWGWNEHGNLGTGDTDGRDAPVEVALAGGAGGGGGAVGVAAGGATTWVAVRS